MKTILQPNLQIKIDGKFESPIVTIKRNRTTCSVSWDIAGLDNDPSVHGAFSSFIDGEEFFGDLQDIVLGNSKGPRRHYICGSLCWGSAKNLTPEVAELLAAEVLWWLESAMIELMVKRHGNLEIGKMPKIRLDRIPPD